MHDWERVSKVKEYIQKRMKINSGVNNLILIIKKYNYILKQITPWTKEVNWTYVDVLDIFWTTYVSSIYVLCVGGKKCNIMLIDLQLHFFPLFLLPSFPPFCFLPDARSWSRSFRACPFSCFPFVLGRLFLVCSLLLFLALLAILFAMPLATAPQIALAPR